MVLLELVPHLGGREHVDLHCVHVGDTALSEGRKHQRILLARGLGRDVLIGRDRRLRAGKVTVLGNDTRIEIDGDLADLSLRVVDCGAATAARQRTAGVGPRQIHVFGGLAGADRDEDRVGRTVGRTCDLGGPAELVGRERVQRVERHT